MNYRFYNLLYKLINTYITIHSTIYFKVLPRTPRAAPAGRPGHVMRRPQPKTGGVRAGVRWKSIQKMGGDRFPDFEFSNFRDLWKSAQFLFLTMQSILQEADFIAADLTKTAPRAQVLDFTEPFMETPLTVLAKVRWTFFYE